jgi:hypothetical protein
MTGRRVRQGLTGKQTRLDDDPSSLGVYSPSRHDPVAAGASTVIGGPAGSRLASRTGFWWAGPVLVLLACVMLSFGVVQKQHCRSVGWYSPDQFWHACYSDIPVLYASNALGSSTRPGLVQELGKGGLGQPPIAGAAMWLSSAFVSNSATSGREYFDLSAVLIAVMLAFAVAAVVFIAGRRSWDAAHLALSPVLITAGLISYEMLAVSLTALALLALARGRPIISGLLFGLAVASAPQVAVLAVVIAVLVTRYLRSNAGLVFLASAIVCWFAVRVVLLPGFSGGLGAAFTSWRQAAPGYGSIWLIPQLLGSSNPQPATSFGGRFLQALVGWLFNAGALSGKTASGLCVVLFGLLAAAVLRLTVIADRPQQDVDPTDDPDYDYGYGEPTPFSEPTEYQAAPPVALSGAFVTTRVAPLGLALLAVVLFTDKALPVQASLLLLPLIALSGLRWRDHLIWAATELAYFVGIWLYIAAETTPNRGLPAVFYMFLIVARLAGIAWVGVQGVLIYRSAQDHGVDPAGGKPDDGTPACGQISSQVSEPGSLLDDRSAEVSQHAG